MLIHPQVWVLVCVCVWVPGWCERSEGLCVACSWWAPGPETAGCTAGTPVPETPHRLHLQTKKCTLLLNTLHSANASQITAEIRWWKRRQNYVGDYLTHPGQHDIPDVLNDGSFSSLLHRLAQARCNVKADKYKLFQTVAITESIDPENHMVGKKKNCYSSVATI